jgi:predicted nucleic acid-binding protein
MRIYFDSSALIKRYVDEPATDEVPAWCDRASELVVTVITVPEIVSADARQSAAAAGLGLQVVAV